MGWAQLERVWGYIVPLPADGSGGTAAGFVLCTWKSRINPPPPVPPPHPASAWGLQGSAAANPEAGQRPHSLSVKAQKPSLSLTSTGARWEFHFPCLYTSSQG